MAMLATTGVAQPANTSQGPVHVSAAFDAGNIVVEGSSEREVNLRIRGDPYTKGTDEATHCQWFYFRASNVKGIPMTYNIVNAGEASYPTAWAGYTTCASYDHETWFRVASTHYSEETGALSWSLASEHDTVWFAYFAPYSYERHQELISRCVASPLAQLTVLGSTLDGRPLDMLTIGTGPLQVWVCARQHPGESMAEWLVEGLLEGLLDGDTSDKEILRKATFHVVPNMNPDGSVRGYLRTNACGANLNREWASTGTYEAPTLQRSPEVYHVLKALDTLGCDLYVDVHGDEEIPANFFADSAGIPGWTPRLEELNHKFSAAMLEASADFQTELGYGQDDPGAANMSICSNQIAQRFDCLAVTLEQPFKDACNNPEPAHGWSPTRAKAFGVSLLEAIHKVLPVLR